MRERAGVLMCVGAAVALLAVLAWPYIQKPARAVTLYYVSGFLNPLLAGALAVGILLTVAAVRENYVSDGFGAGIAIGLGAFTFLVVLAWSVTARVDVFRAPGWALPAHRFIVVGLSILVVAGAGWHAWANGHLSRPD